MGPFDRLEGVGGALRQIGHGRPGHLGDDHVGGPLVADLFLEGEAELIRHNMVFEHLRAIALSPSDTVTLLTSQAKWRTSRFSGNGASCVEVAVLRGRDAGVPNKAGEEFVVALRDTKNRDREPQIFTISEWDAFLAGVAEGDFSSASLIAGHEDVAVV
ncbi:DUF397 domain-containing protein [Nonomuraea glycinis]|uniref:DUF397 domain-containing protein n=1 Tax=Nonomuraea glycinis TaxID=2047744 RepID=UPI001CDA4A84|nr:DUF397 domain-containing protein [Nonomuraea glycinis]MCA2178232.1 DUF397 domain-containing protein [Nonomuraea glycinis]